MQGVSRSLEALILTPPSHLSDLTTPLQGHVFFVVGMDVGLAVYKRYLGEETGVGYAAHFGGALAG